VQGDDAEDGSGQEGGYGDEQEGCVGAEVGDCGGSDLPKLTVVAPCAQRCCGADEHGGEGECDQEKLETDVWAGGEPVDDVARGLRGFVGGGLNVAKEEGEHEKGGGEDEEDFECGDGTFGKHGRFIVQSTM
jgi:hypothetical protein